MALFYAATAVLLALRIFLARAVSIWFPADQRYDDALMMQYADLAGHFSAQNAPFNELLLKDMGFPIFLRLADLTGLPYTDVLSLLWFIAAATSVALFASATGGTKKIIWLAIFAFVLFAPIAFDDWGGTRLYRNAALTPLYFIFLNMTALIFVRHFDGSDFSTRKFLAFQIALGLTFTLTFYMKEDGIWLLAVLGVVTLICCGKILLAEPWQVENKIWRLVLLILPLTIFFAGTNFYKAVNYKYFGVCEINIRGGGETGKFVNSVYAIQSDSRTGKIWAPADAVAKAFDASATLRANPELREAVFHTPWFGGDIFANPIRGDFLGWVLLTAIKDSGTCNSAVGQEDFFRAVNAEIDAAFEGGELQRDSKFQLVSSMGGRSVLEILGLTKLLLREYAMHVALYKYSAGAHEIRSAAPQNSEQERVLATASNLTNTDLTAPNGNAAAANFFVQILFALYAVLQVILFIAAAVALCQSFRRRISLPVLIAAGSLTLSLVYALAIAWFCEFITPSELRSAALKFYSVGLVPMLMTFEIFGAYLFFSSRNKNFFRFKR